MVLSWRSIAGATALLSIAVWTLSHFAPDRPLWTLVRVMGELAFILTTLWLPGYSVLKRFMRQRLKPQEIELLAAPTTLALSLLVFVLLYAVSAPLFLYRAVYLGTLLWSAVWAVRHALSEDRGVAVPRSYLLVGLLALFAISFVCTGVQGSPWGTMSWTVPANRATHPLPVDNSLQWDTAQVFIAGSEPWAWNDGYSNWSMGDRPPLLGAVTAIYAKSYFSYRRLRYFDYTLLAICLNALYVLPVVHLARRLRASLRVSLLATLSLALTPYFIVNTYFTWPKFLGMSFTLTALAFFIARKPDDPWTWTRPAGAALLGTLLSLGALCHGGAFLSVPLVILVVAVSGRDWKPRRSLAGIAMLSLAMATVSLPWTIYKAWHPAIQTQNLIYHYRAVIDRPGNPVPLQEWLESVPLQKQLEIRWTHVVDVLSKSEFRATWNAYLGGTLDTFYAARWPKEFFYPMSQVDEMRWLIGGFAAVVLLLAALLAKHTRYNRWPVTRLSPLNAAGVLLLLAVAICSYVLNIFAKWAELVPHALPMAEVACVIVSLALLAYGASRWLGHCVLAVVLLRFVHFSITSTIERNQPLFGVFGFAFLAAGALMVWLAFSTQEAAADPA